MKKKFETGEILPIYHDGVKNKKLEGWAILIKPKSLPLTIIESDLSETDDHEIDYNITLKQKWLVRWVDPIKYKLNLNPSEKISQSILVGKKCNRLIFRPIGLWSQVKSRKDLFNNSSHFKTRPFESRQDKDNSIF